LSKNFTKMQNLQNDKELIETINVIEQWNQYYLAKMLGWDWPEPETPLDEEE